MEFLNEITYSLSTNEVIGCLIMIIVSVYIAIGWATVSELRKGDTPSSAIRIFASMIFGIICVIYFSYQLFTPIETCKQIKITDKNTLELLENYEIKDFNNGVVIAKDLNEENVNKIQK